MMYGDNYIDKYEFIADFFNMGNFFSNDDIRNAKNLILPATTLTNGCYASMF